MGQKIKLIFVMTTHSEIFRIFVVLMQTGIYAWCRHQINRKLV